MVLLYCTPVADNESNNQFSVATVQEAKVVDCILQRYSDVQYEKNNKLVGGGQEEARCHQPGRTLQGGKGSRLAPPEQGSATGEISDEKCQSCRSMNTRRYLNAHLRATQQMKNVPFPWPLIFGLKRERNKTIKILH
jgi:hypothetical protein